MLEGIDQSTIIVGAYTDGSGGVCPMLAAHRRGGRTALASFARAWDRYTRVGSGSRRATGRELRTLKSMLEGSLVRDEAARGELAEAIAELKAIKARRATPEDREGRVGRRRATPPASHHRPRRRPTGERDRSSELSRRAGWAWLRVFRRYDDYEAALERVRHAERTVDQRERELA
jgi:hypothetical protein